MRDSPLQEPIQITTTNPAAVALGIVAIILGVFALLVSWIPLLGLFAIPFAFIGGAIGLAGCICSLVTKLRGIVLPLIGTIFCGGSIVFLFLSIGATSNVIEKVTEGFREGQIEASRVNDAKKAEAAQKAESQRNAKTDYINQHLELYEFSSEYIDTFTEKHIPGVDFKIKNKGDRSLDQVEVTVYFHDAEGKIIAEQDFNPVYVSKFNSGKPLKPGYIWNQEKGHVYLAKNIPSEAEGGKVTAQISQIKFTED